jgi:hypothetical protein
MVSRGLYLDKNVRIFSITQPNLADKNAIMEIELRKTLDRFIGKKNRLVVVLDNPEMSFDPKSCISRPLNPTDHLNKTCAIPRKDFDEMSKEYRDLIMSVLKYYPTLKVFDATAKLYDQQWCWVVKDKKMLYRDGDHLSLDGSKLQAVELLKLLNLMCALHNFSLGDQ